MFFFFLSMRRRFPWIAKITDRKRFGVNWETLKSSHNDRSTFCDSSRRDWSTASASRCSSDEFSFRFPLRALTPPFRGKPLTEMNWSGSIVSRIVRELFNDRLMWKQFSSDDHMIRLVYRVVLVSISKSAPSAVFCLLEVCSTFPLCPLCPLFSPLFALFER